MLNFEETDLKVTCISWDLGLLSILESLQIIIMICPFFPDIQIDSLRLSDWFLFKSNGGGGKEPLPRTREWLHTQSQFHALIHKK
jgi:hypothetical protein